MNDNLVRGPQWQPLVAQFFAPILGGEQEAWERANYAIMESFFRSPDAWEQRLAAASDYESFDRAYMLDWLGGMCAMVGVPCPSEDESVALAHEATDLIIPQIRSAFLGAVDTIRTLHGQGYTLHTASGESSRDLTGYLTGMGVLDCFDRLYGPDLVEIFKFGPEYYERIMADAGVSPPEALVVDDSPRVLAWAAKAGARTALVGAHSVPQRDGTLRIGSLAELPALLG